jgi:hypothetical protein
VKLSPFKHKSKRPVRELAVDGARFDFYRDFEFSVHRVKMRYTVLVEKHADDDAEEPTDLRHAMALRAGGVGACDTRMNAIEPSETSTTMPSSARASQFTFVALKRRAPAK